MDAFDALRTRLSELEKQGEGGFGLWPQGLAEEARRLDALVGDASRDAEQQRAEEVSYAQAEAESWRDAHEEERIEFFSNGERLLELVVAGDTDAASDLIRSIWGSGGQQLLSDAAVRGLVAARGLPLTGGPDA